MSIRLRSSGYVALSLALLGVACAGAGCSSTPPSEETSSAAQEVTTCTGPYEHIQCVEVCGSGPPNGSSGSVDQVRRPEGCVQSCPCTNVAEVGSMPGWPSSTDGGLNVSNPPSSLAQCLPGLTFVNGCAPSGISVWACPPRTPVPPSILEDAGSQCVWQDSLHGYVNPSDGSAPCELILSSLGMPDDAIGPVSIEVPSSGWFLVMDGVVDSGYGGKARSQTSCTGGCMLPH